MKEIQDELFDEILDELGICIPDCDVYLKEVIDDNCKRCRRVELCRKIAASNLL